MLMYISSQVEESTKIRDITQKNYFLISTVNSEQILRKWLIYLTLIYFILFYICRIVLIISNVIIY